MKDKHSQICRLLPIVVIVVAVGCLMVLLITNSGKLITVSSDEKI